MKFEMRLAPLQNCIPLVFGVAALAFAPNTLLAQEDGLVLEEIIVTARKRDESPQSIPLSVTPFTADILEERGFTGLEDIPRLRPDSPTRVLFPPRTALTR